MQCYNYNTRKFFLFGARIFFGCWLLYVGLAKWIFVGPETFVGMIVGDFDKTWSPHFFNVALGRLIMLAEPLLALWLLSGQKPRSAWTLTALLMFLLTMGQTILMKAEVSDNWQYLVLALACAAMHEPETAAKNC